MNALLSRLQTVALRTPNALAVDGDEPLTYSDIYERIRQRISHFEVRSRRGAIILRAHNSVSWIVDFVSGQAAGLWVLAVPPDCPLEQVYRYASLFGSADLVDSPGAEPVRLSQLSACEEMPVGEGFALPTSGSTGEPRLALRSSLSLAEEGDRYREFYGLLPKDRVLVALPMAHAFMLGAAIGTMIATGCTLVLQRLFAPRVVASALHEDNIQVLPLVPSAARLLCQVAQPGGNALRTIIIGAGRVSPDLSSLLSSRLGRPPRRNYGSTETGATLGTADDHCPPAATGRPMPGVSVALSGQDRSGAGALFIRTSTPFVGYLTESGIDARASGPGGWFSTSDRAWIREDGYVEVSGRFDRVVRRHGRSISLAAVENAVLGHPGVTDAVAVVDRDNQGDPSIRLHVEIQANVNVASADLQDRVADNLGEYCVPQSIIVSDALPRTIAGKLDAQALQRSINPCLEARRRAFAHRTWLGILAAEHFGILDALATASSVDEIALETGCQRELAAAVVDRLRFVAFISSQGEINGRALAADVALRRILRYELSSLGIDRQLDGLFGPTKRRPATDSDAAYTSLMHPLARLAALNANRVLRDANASRILEIGCPNVGLRASIGTHTFRPDVVTVQVPRKAAPISPLPQGPFDAIYIFNSSRRLAAAFGAEWLLQVIDGLCPGGIVIGVEHLADCRVSEIPEWSGVMLDWAIDGLAGHPKWEDMCHAFQSAGLSLTDRRDLGSGLAMIVAKRDALEEQCATRRSTG